MPRHVVLLSGGLDSAVACALAAFRDGPADVLALGVAYGQRHINELIHARAFAAAHGVAFVLAHVDPSPWKRLPLTTGTTASNRPVYAMQTGGVSDAFLPGRNVAFLALALSVAGVQGASRIWIGANKDDAARFPDRRPPFLRPWQQMAGAALGRTIHLEAPLLNRTNREVVALARQMALDIDATWSCYRPQADPRGAVPCGCCDACRLRAEALA